MKIIFESHFIFHDHLLTDIARIYSNEYKIPFFVMVGDFEGYDISSKSGEHRIEVKFETTPIRTNNVALEYWNTDFDKPSGVLATDANLWVHIVKDEKGFTAYEYDINILRKITIECGETKPGGRNSLCRIIPLEIFKKYARRSFQLAMNYSLN